MVWTSQIPLELSVLKNGQLCKVIMLFHIYLQCAKRVEEVEVLAVEVVGVNKEVEVLLHLKQVKLTQMPLTLDVAEAMMAEVEEETVTGTVEEETALDLAVEPTPDW